jgi:CRP-like cAMP-binding protein
MPVPAISAPRNRLLAALPPASATRLFPQLERVALPLRQVLYEPGGPIAHVYFLLGGVVSLVTLFEAGGAVEASLVGNEGMVGLPLFHGVRSDTNQAIVQVNDWALRMPAAAFQSALANDNALRDLLGRYTQSLLSQMSQGAGCNRLHPVNERCARWLLQTQDRAGAAGFPMTHDFLATMLGVRRASVTIAAGALQQAGLIRYQRGRMTIINRAGLEAASCECYKVMTAALDALLPPLPPLPREVDAAGDSAR